MNSNLISIDQMNMYSSFTYKTILASFLFFISAVYPFSNISAQNTLLEENFDQSLNYPWQTSSGNMGGWAINVGEYVGKAHSSQSIPSIATAGDTSWKNYKISVDINSISGVDRHIYFRFDKNRTNPPGYGVKIRNNNYGFAGTIELQKINQVLLGGGLKSYISQIGQKTKVEIEVVDQKIKVFLNNSATPIFDVEDATNPILDGGIALYVQNPGFTFQGFDGYNKTGYDNLRVENIEEETQLNIPSIKQFSQPWGTDVYDAASTWAGTYGTIARWGCAITSTSMLLNHYGYNFTPRDINNFLKDHNGYLRNGAVIWNSVSRMVKENSDGTKPILEYNRVGFNSNEVKSRIDNNIPSIIKLTNPIDQSTHFVLAKGYSPTNIFINDPGVEKTKLSEYPSEFPTRADFFTPSNTDLSYIYLAYPIGTEISLYSPTGQLIQGSRFLEYPPYDNQTKQPNPNPALNLLTVAKPEHGRYQIEVNSDKSYFIDTYLFNKDGVLKDGTVNSFEDKSRTDVFYFDIGNENFSPEKLGFGYIGKRLNYWNSQGAISQALFKNIKLQLDLAEKRFNSGDKKTVKPTLNALVKLIKRSTPKLISNDASLDLTKIITKYVEVI